MLPVREGRLTNKVIILDLDHTLICTLSEETKNIYNQATRGREGRPASFSPSDIPLVEIHMDRGGMDGNFNVMETIFRPHYKEFLMWCNTYFSYVIIWTAAIRSYAVDVVNSLYSDIDQKPDYIFSRESCTVDDRDKTLKSFDKLYKGNSFLQAFSTYKNTIIVDDTSSTFAENQSNAIHIPGYLKSNFSAATLMQDDECLLLIKYWFLQKEIIESSDLREHDKSVIFKKSLSEMKKKMTRLPSTGPYIFSRTSLK